MKEVSELSGGWRERAEDAGLALPVRVVALVDGAPLEVGSGTNWLPLHYPGSGEVLGELQECNAEEVDRAVSAARRSFVAGVWSQQSVAERQVVLRRVQGLLEQHKDELGLLECLGVGLPLAHLRDRQIPRAAENFGFFADVIGQMAGESFQQLPSHLSIVTREPVGVCAVLAPWNASLALCSMHIAACIAFGNSCVLKPSEHASLSLPRLMALLQEAGVPDGVVNLVTGRGPVTGAALCAHPGIDRIALTGRAETAREVMRSAAAHLTPVHFELGGNAPTLVFDDADLDAAIDAALLGAYSNSGQLCVAGSRLLLQRGIAREFTERLSARIGQLRVGAPLDPGTEVGPLAFAAQRERVLSLVRRACSEGARCLHGGELVSRPGFYMAPTLLSLPSRRLQISREEVFGPVATLQVFDAEEDAWELANDSDYGLLAYVWTASLQRALDAQARLQVGTVWINTPLARDLRAPFGGVKGSGIGREGPRHSAAFYTEEKSTIVARQRVAMRRLGLP
jgi:acyl-CoA reductase-like NAD-dependent aldehyde dehydrogenase